MGKLTEKEKNLKHKNKPQTLTPGVFFMRNQILPKVQ